MSTWWVTTSGHLFSGSGDSGGSGGAGGVTEAVAVVLEMAA